MECSADCVEGQCVEVSPCTVPNPAGCERDADCGAGQICRPLVEPVCIPVGCACTLPGNTWSCRDDCGGGECVAADK